MRFLALIFLSLSLRLMAETALPAPSAVDLAPIQTKLQQHLHAKLHENAPDAAKALGLNTLHSASQSNLMLDDTWLSQITLERDQRGLFQLLKGNTQNNFIAPDSTDIAIRASLDLSTIVDLTLAFHHSIDQEEHANALLDQKLGGASIRNFLNSDSPTTIELCIDFSEDTPLHLGKESIGKPDFALHIIGKTKQLEAILAHYMRSRNALFTEQQSALGSTYTLPDYFADAIAGYLPVIHFNHQNDSTTIASSQAMLLRIQSPHDSLYLDANFRETWDELPSESQFKAYISKRALEGLQHFYLLALQEKWTDNPAFLQKKFQITAAVAQLNSSEKGIAISIQSDEKSDTITFKSPIPSNFLLWLLAR